MKKINFIKIALSLSLLALIAILAISCQAPETEACSEHQAGEWIIDAEPTCSSAGSKHTECTLCGETVETQAIEALAHTEIIIEGKAPTCSETGLTQGKKCSVCSATLVEQETIAVIPHTEVIVESVAATCSKTGLTQGKKCSVCSTTLVAQETTATIPHTEEIIEGKKATCSETGLTQGKKCSVCSTPIIEQTTIPALEHVESDWITDTAATETENGSKHKECTLCHTVLATEAIPAIGAGHVHAGSTWTVTKPATCAEAGVKSFVCSCGETVETQEIPKTTTHTEQTILGKAPTCKEQGLTDGKICTVCNTVTQQQTPIDTIPHTEVKLPGKTATCKEQGLTEGKVCSVCGTVTLKQSPTATAGHTEVDVLGSAPSCTESGTTDGKICSVCGVTTVTQVPVAPKGHSFVGGVCTNCGFNGNYGLWITDGLGMPLTNIIVNIKKDGETVKMIQYKGQYVTFDLEDGNYTVELDLSGLDEEYVYDTEACVLTPEKKSLNLKLYRTASAYEEPLYVGAPVDADYNATAIYEAGSYKMTLTPNDYTFFVFTPGTAAIYTITYECEGELRISYHGGTFFVQGNDVSEGNSEFSKYDNGLAVNVYSSSIGMSYVFAIRSNGATECILNIQNVGDPGTRLVEAPWTAYQEDAAKVEEMKAYPQEGTYTTIDLGDTSISAVLNPSDGYYHLGSVDGPVLFLDFTTDSKYIASIYTICSNQRMGAYIYDADGNLVEKRSYNELFFQCGMPDPLTAETTPNPGIRVPLTEKLAEAIQKFGTNQGWWQEGSSTNIFSTAFEGLPFNQEYAWLLYCGYYQ